MNNTYDGSFSRSSFVSVDDPYIEKRPLTVHKDHQEKRNFTTNPPKKGQTASTIGPGPIDFKAAYVGEPFVDEYKIHARHRAKNKEKFRNPAGFRYSSPMKKSSSTGDFYGSFLEHDERTKTHINPGPLLPKDYMHLTFKTGNEKNFLTSPSKRGGPGYPGRLLNSPDTEYKPEPFDELQRRAHDSRLEHHKMVGERKPFVSTSKRLDMFDAYDHAAISKVYSEDGAVLPARQNSGVGLSPMQLTAKRRAQTATGVFRPSSPPKIDTMHSTFSGFPEHMAEPFNEKLYREAKIPDRLKPHAAQLAKLPATLKERKPFMPPTIPKSGVIKSTAKMGLNVNSL